MTPNIYNLLSEHKLAEALGLLQSKVESLHDEVLIGQYHVLHDNYKAYLQAQMQTVDAYDLKDAEPFYRHAYSINDRANRRIRMLKAPNDQYAVAWRSGESMFDRVWTADLWDDKEKEAVWTYMELNPQDAPLMVSAMTLALFEMFDERKLMCLLDACAENNDVVSLRALVGVILVLRRYDTRIAHYTQIMSRLSLLAEDGAFVKRFFSAHVILQYSKLTDSVSDKMRNDIIPALVNSTRFRKTEMGLEEIDEALTSNGENPDWVRNMMADKTVDRKIRQMAKMQTEGADIYMATFRYMKNYSFFSKMQNWFEPFSVDNRELQDMECTPLINKLLAITPFSDSDKYSFLFMIRQMGDKGSRILQSQLEQQLPDDVSLDELISDETKGRDSMVSGNKAEKLIRRYSQDLYRFYNLYTYRSQFFNPFDSKLSNFTPLGRMSFRDFVGHTDEMLNLAEFFMRKGLYQDALDIFLLVKKDVNPDDEADLLQKIGFCEQKLGDNDHALADLLKADGLHPNSHWTVLHISQVAFELGQYQTAIHYLDMLIAEEPEDIKHLTRKAECLFAIDQYAEALPILYKVAYLDDHHLLGHQMLAWGLLMTRAFEKSEKEYAKCAGMEDETAEIYLGHICAMQGMLSDAATHYQVALDLYRKDTDGIGPGQERFMRDFWSPVSYLCRIDANTQRFSLILESVLMS